jgi:protein associated with RNAse G/E
MEKLTVLSKKYDGSLREEYQSNVYAQSDETITLFSFPGMKFRDHRKSAWLQAEDGLIEIYFKHKWYNVWHICEQISQRNLIYVNISLPAAFHPAGIEWIDLDLDYRMHLDGSVERLDQAEFEENIKLMRYPADHVEQAQTACMEVEAGLIMGNR